LPRRMELPGPTSGAGAMRRRKCAITQWRQTYPANF
jgi:hypothetical protein